ncbi:MAG: LutB/LldF family L-lactate oxidation iron-sulfur protein [Chloroflexota bacterium]
MQRDPRQFLQSAQIAIDDIELRGAIDRATGRANEGRERTMDETTDRAALRQQGRGARLRGLHALPELLEQAEGHMQANGMRVCWALDAAEANQQVLAICQEHGARRGVKSKSMVTEEIGLVPFLESNAITMLETDLGEYIVQISDDHPSHITMPVMHRSKESIRDVLMDKAGMPYVETPEEMTAFARARLRQHYLDADFGVSGGNFIIAETGHIVTVTNEGNARLTTGVPPVHIAVIGIEKVIPTWEDFATLVQLLTRSATGQRMTVYVNLIAGPARADDGDGPQHVYVILLDNGRSGIYASEYAEALACIRCGACLNACPVYQSVGGHAYGTVYPGPIGAVISPLLLGKENASPLPFASTLCGACKTACPVDIDIPTMLLKLRRDLHESEAPLWRLGLKGFGAAFSHPLLYRAAGFVGRQVAGGDQPLSKLPYPLDGWTDSRNFPPLAEQPFRAWWREHEAQRRQAPSDHDKDGS